MSPACNLRSAGRVKGVLAVRFGSRAAARRSACLLKQCSEALGSSQWTRVIPGRGVRCSCIPSAGAREVICAATRPLNLVFCSIAPQPQA